MIFILPKPPSINHIYGRSGNRTYITKEGKNWFEDAGELVKKSWNGSQFTQPCQVRVVLYTCRRQDLDNILKPLLDLLQKTGVIENDNLIDNLAACKIKVAKTEEHIEIEVTESLPVSFEDQGNHVSLVR